MSIPLGKKSSLSEIEHRFENDVERFSKLETGQAATIDAPLAMELITSAAIAAAPKITRTLDIGCGAGNNTIQLLRSSNGNFDVDLNDLSGAMLQRARERVSRETSGKINIIHGDFRTAEIADNSYDVILAAAVLHHLRDDQDWEYTFTKIYRLLRPGGSFWITDLVSHENQAIHDLMWMRYGDYLETNGGQKYREEVFAYIEKEDSPRSTTYQLELLKRVGFTSTDILHKNSCFSAFGAVKGRNG